MPLLRINLRAQRKVTVVLTANTHTLRSGEHTRPHYSEGTDIAILRSSISTPLCIFSAQFAIDKVHSAPIIFRSACTGGAQPLVARARTPVCPSLATPVCVSAEGAIV